MRTEYDFSKAKRNQYAKRLKKAVTIRLEPDIIDYFKSLTTETGIPYQNLITDQSCITLQTRPVG